MRRSSRLKSGKVVSKYIQNKGDRLHDDDGDDVSSDNAENTSKSILEEHPSEMPSENETSEEETYNQHEELFDGNIGTWNTELVHLELKPGTTPYHGKPSLVTVKDKGKFKCKIEYLVSLGV